MIEARDNENIRIAFGSCFKFYRNHKTNTFKRIQSMNPDVFIWLGDFAYLDDMVWGPIWYQSGDPDQLRLKFNATKYDPDYQILVNSRTKIIGIYDDHDTGMDNSDRHNPHLQLIKSLYLDALDVPKSDIKRRQGEGLFDSYYIGRKQQVQVILIDVRTFKDSKKLDPEPLSQLGEEQFLWLEDELNQSKAELIVLGNGLQFMPDDRFFPESWYPESRERVYKLIKQYGKRVIIISGDVHFAELMEHPCGIEKVGYRLFEMTSSGLSMDFDHTGYLGTEVANHIFMPDTFGDRKDRYFKKNYGVIDVKLDERNMSNSEVHLQIYSPEKNQKLPKLQKVIKFSDLNQQKTHDQEEGVKGNCLLNEITPKERYHNYIKEGLVREIRNGNWSLIFFMVFLMMQAMAVVGVYVFLIKLLTCNMSYNKEIEKNDSQQDNSLKKEEKNYKKQKQNISSQNWKQSQIKNEMKDDYDNINQTSEYYNQNKTKTQ